MNDTLKRAFSRPIQLSSYAVIGIATYHLLPKDADTLQWLAYLFIYVATLALAMDNYREGFERGLKLMEKMS